MGPGVLYSLPVEAIKRESFYTCLPAKKNVPVAMTTTTVAYHILVAWLLYISNWCL